MAGSLSTVVSDLVRAQMGASVSNMVTNEDLDRHVAELILKEAKQKAERYGKDGIRAFLQSARQESNAPKTNKRFLSSIIRNTDDHNKSILKAQAQSAAEIRIEREEQERAERRARAEEAVAAERMRRSSRWHSDDSWAKERQKRERSWERRGEDDEYDDGGESRRYDRRRRAGDGAERDDGVPGESRRAKRHRHRSRSNERISRRDEDSSRRPSRSRSPLSDGGHHRRRRHRSRSPSPDADGHSSRRRPRSRSLEDEDRGTRHRRRRHRSRSRSADGSSARRHHKHSRHRDESRMHHRLSRAPSHSPPGSPRRSRSVTLSDDGVRAINSNYDSSAQEAGPSNLDAADREAELRRKLKGKAKAHPDPSSRSHTSTPVPKRRRLDSPSPNLPPPPPRSPPPPLPRSRPRSPSPGPPSPVISRPDLPSKMDKYFAASYDPRLDVAPLAAPKVPATGLIDNAEFEEWDAMLELIRIRREDKEEKKRMERLGLLDKSKSGKGKEKKGEGSGVTGAMNGWAEGAESLMGIEYKKRGTVREWDMGKEVPT